MENRVQLQTKSEWLYLTNSIKKTDKQELQKKHRQFWRKKKDSPV